MKIRTKMSPRGISEISFPEGISKNFLPKFLGILTLICVAHIGAFQLSFNPSSFFSEQTEHPDIARIIFREEPAHLSDEKAFDPDRFKKFKGLRSEELEKALVKNIPKSLRKSASRYIKAVLKISKKHEIDPMWVLSIMWTESHFKFKAKSHVGARGLMQIMPKTKKYIYKKYRKDGQWLVVEEDGFSFSEVMSNKVSKRQKRSYIKRLANIELGVIYLKYLLEKFDNDHMLATVAYNMGPGWTIKRLRAKRPIGTQNKYLDKVEYAYNKITRTI